MGVNGKCVHFGGFFPYIIIDTTLFLIYQLRNCSSSPLLSNSCKPTMRIYRLFEVFVRIKEGFVDTPKVSGPPADKMFVAENFFAATCRIFVI